MRLIDADAMLEYLNLMYDKQNDSDEPFNCAVLGAINYIKHKVPTIDAVSVDEWCHDCKEYDKEKHSCPRFNRVIRTALKDADMVSVVRCKDCMFSEVYQNDSSGVMVRFCEAFTQVRMVSDDDFCSYGERKETDHE